MNTQTYWIITSKRKPKLWCGTKDDYYDCIYMTKEDAEDTLTETDKKYYRAVKIEAKILEKL